MPVSQPDVQTVVLVEGPSDAAVLRVLASRLGRNLAANAVDVVSMDGVTNIGHHLRRLRPTDRGLAVAGLCDSREERFLRGALEREGLAAATRAEMAKLGFFVCEADLEDELLKVLGVVTAEEVLRSEGELHLFRRFQHQPAQRQRPVHDQLHRFAGVRSGRKVRLAASLAAALDLDHLPDPLRDLLKFVDPAGLGPVGPQ